MNPFPALLTLLRWLRRPLAMVAIWLTATGFFATAYLMSGKWVRINEATAFTAAFAGAAVISAIIVWALDGKRRWAFEAVLCIIIPTTTGLGLTYGALWLTPTIRQYLSGTSTRAFVRNNRPPLLDTFEEVTEPALSTGAFLGVAIGAIAGLLALVERRHRRLAAGLIIGLLLVCVVSSLHLDGFRQLTEWLMRWRLAGVKSSLLSWVMAKELASAMGATSGSVVGAALACVAARIGPKPGRGS
jgi:hypothetical protein